MKNLTNNGTLLTLGLVGVVAAAGAIKNRGSMARTGKSMRGKLLHADLLEELGSIDRLEVIGSVKHPPKGMSEDATYVVLLHLPEGWSVVLFDDEDLHSKVEYESVPNEAMARAMADHSYGHYNHHAMRFNWSEMKEWMKYAPGGEQTSRSRGSMARYK
jgi:hypothetical protein